MKAFYLIVQTMLGVVCLSFAMLSAAQDEDAEIESTSPAEEEAIDSVAPPATNQDSFIPSEKINADTEISFPIDI